MINNYQPKIQKVNPQSHIYQNANINPSNKTLNNFNANLLKKQQQRQPLQNQNPNLFNRGSINQPQKGNVK